MGGRVRSHRGGKRRGRGSLTQKLLSPPTAASQRGTSPMFEDVIDSLLIDFYLNIDPSPFGMDNYIVFYFFK